MRGREERRGEGWLKKFRFPYIFLIINSGGDKGELLNFNFDLLSENVLFLNYR